MSQNSLFRRVTASLLACTLLASCSAPAPDSDDSQKASAGPDASAAKVAAPAGQGGGASRAPGDIAFLATARPLACAGTGFFPVDSAIVTATGRWQRASVPGGHFLRFDTAAVDSGTMFIVKRAYADTAALEVRPAAPPVQYKGLVGLTINYRNCAGADTTGYALFRKDSTGLELQGRANRNRTVTAELDHFSTYIVAGN
jgi:hypothetical protein